MSSPESDPSQGATSTLLDPETVQDTRELVDALVRTLKTLRLYDPTNAVYLQALETIGLRIFEYVADYGTLTLSVGRDHLHWMGEVLYRDEHPNDGLAFRLHADGIRAIGFKDGIPEVEARQAVVLLALGSALDSQDDDLVTLFWDAGLSHVEITSVSEEPPPEALAPAHPQQPPTDLGGMVDRVRSDPPPQGAQPVAFGPEVLGAFRLTDQDRAHIDGLIKRERELDAEMDLVGILTDVLTIEQDPADFAEMADHYGAFLINYLRRGRLDIAVRQVQGIATLGRRPDLTPEMTTALERVMTRLTDGDGMAALSDGIGHRFASKGEPDEADLALLGDYLSALPVGDPVVLMPVAVASRPGPVRDRILAAAARFCDGSGVALAPLLEDNDAELVKCAVNIIGQVGQMADLPALEPLSSHPDEGVRRAALDAISRIAVDGHLFMLPYLRDPETSVRRRALAAVTGANYRDALEVLKEITTGSLFTGPMRMGERRAVFAAIGALGGDDALDFFAKHLVKRRRLWGKRKGEDISLCAVSGVKAVGTEAARKALAEACEHHNERVSAAAKFALRELEGDQ